MGAEKWKTKGGGWGWGGGGGRKEGRRKKKRKEKAYSPIGIAMDFDTRKQSMAWIKHGLQMSLKRYALSMEDKLEAGPFGRATNYEWDGKFVLM